jgi:hypothetical protein
MPEPTLSDVLANIGMSYGPWLTAGAILLSAIIGASVAVLAIAHQRGIARKRSIIDNLLRKNWDKDYIQIRKDFVRLREDRDALLEAAKQDNQSGDDASVIRSILNDYEIIALGIRRDILDERIFKLWFKTTFLNDYEKMRPFVAEVRQRNRRAFVELEGLAEKWKKRDNSWWLRHRHET